MTPRVPPWLRLALVPAALVLGAAPPARADLTGEAGQLTEQIGRRIEHAPDPIAGLTDAQLAGQRVVVGFDGRTAPRAVLRRVAAGELGGVILFTRNLGSRGALRRMTARLQEAARQAPGGRPVLIMVDQEGGQVSRLRGPPKRSPAELGRVGSAAIARSEGRATARNLAAVGINVDLAPVVDVGRPGRNMAELGRSYANSTRRVTRLGAAFAAGLAAGGVLSCAKHFPGLGLARTDEDFSLNRIGESLGALRRTDEPPFTRTRTPMVMVSTGVYRALGRTPALFNRRAVMGELRRHLGFAGTTITDDLEVPVLARAGSAADRALAAAKAGNDLLLFAQDTGAGFAAAEALRHALADGTLQRSAFEAAARRSVDLRDGLNAG
jgi:beta-N-acetylhexosaminidase